MKGFWIFVLCLCTFTMTCVFAQRLDERIGVKKTDSPYAEAPVYYQPDNGVRNIIVYAKSGSGQPIRHLSQQMVVQLHSDFALVALRRVFIKNKGDSMQLAMPFYIHHEYEVGYAADENENIYQTSSAYIKPDMYHLRVKINGHVKKMVRRMESPSYEEVSRFGIPKYYMVWDVNEEEDTVVCDVKYVVLYSKKSSVSCSHINIMPYTSLVSPARIDTSILFIYIPDYMKYQGISHYDDFRILKNENWICQSGYNFTPNSRQNITISFNKDRSRALPPDKRDVEKLFHHVVFYYGINTEGWELLRSQLFLVWEDCGWIRHPDEEDEAPIGTILLVVVGVFAALVLVARWRVLRIKKQIENDN